MIVEPSPPAPLPAPSPCQTHSSMRKDKRTREDKTSDDNDDMGNQVTGALIAGKTSRTSLKIMLTQEKKPLTKWMKLWEYDEDTVGDGTIENPI